MVKSGYGYKKHPLKMNTFWFTCLDHTVLCTYRYLNIDYKGHIGRVSTCSLQRESTGLFQYIRGIPQALTKKTDALQINCVSNTLPDSILFGIRVSCAVTL